MAVVMLLVRSAPAESRSDDAAAEIAAAMARSVDVERGREAYESCAVCHGLDGSGSADGTFPQLAGQHASVIIKQLADIRSGFRENPIMLPYAEQLIDPQQLANVAGYLASLPRPTGHGRGAGTDLATGARLYGRACTGCHGAAGEGDASRFIPSLVGQHYGYLLRQIRDIAAGRRGDAHPEMASLIEELTDAELQALVDFAVRLGSPSAQAARQSAQ
jgi:cytochrome c553